MSEETLKRLKLSVASVHDVERMLDLDDELREFLEKKYKGNKAKMVEHVRRKLFTVVAKTPVGTIAGHVLMPLPDARHGKEKPSRVESSRVFVNPDYRDLRVGSMLKEVTEQAAVGALHKRALPVRFEEMARGLAGKGLLASRGYQRIQFHELTGEEKGLISRKLGYNTWEELMQSPTGRDEIDMHVSRFRKDIVKPGKRFHGVKSSHISAALKKRMKKK